MVNNLKNIFQGVYHNPEIQWHNIHNIQDTVQIAQHIKNKGNETHSKGIIQSQSQDDTDIWISRQRCKVSVQVCLMR